MSLIKNTRPATVAGSFYPSDPEKLSDMINSYLTTATSTNIIPKIIISPHAGYVYSGGVMASAFKTLIGSDYKRVILIGRSHQSYFDGASIDNHDFWQTPLGQVAVDKNFIQKLTSVDNETIINSKPHATEHALEVIIPFLQKTLSNNFKIVPILLGSENSQTAENLAIALSKIIDDQTVIIISSDLSHYPKYEDANNFDKQTLDSIASGKIENFVATVTKIEQTGATANEETAACGAIAIETGMRLAILLNLSPKILNYQNIGDTAPETKNSVVGYGAVGFFDATKQSSDNQTTASALSSDEQKIAIQIARESLNAILNKQKYITPKNLPKIFSQKLGVFVTLNENNNLRGCIGKFEPDTTLAELISEMAKSAALEDPRFNPVVASELKNIKIEISILSPMSQINNADEITMGINGVYIKSGRRSGTYLPQVAEDFNNNKEKFLNSLCVDKAGLPINCWRDGSAELYIYTAQVFEE